MKKITFLFFLALIALKSQGQCIQTYQYTTVTSDNMGMPQTITDCGYTTTNYLVLQNMIVGGDYIFTNTLGAVDKYITITDVNNEVIEHGYSPLAVGGITSATVRVHITDNDGCGGTATCHKVTVQALLSCPLPENLLISDITTTSAFFTWEPTGSETAWEVIALPSTSAAPASDLTEGVSTVNDNPEFTATLLPATSYKFYYRAVCSDTDKSPWNSSAVFKTPCEEATYFSEGFDAGTTLPSCFARLGTAGTLYVQSEAGAASSPNVLVMGGESILMLPTVSNFAEATHRIKFKLRCIYGLGGTIEFGYFMDPLDVSSFVALETFNANSLTAFDEYTFEPGTEAQTGNFAFRHASGNNWVVVDDVIWEPIPSCSDVTLLKTDSFTSNTASLSWTSEEDSWEVVYGVAATTANPNGLTPQVVEENTVVLSNLEASTAYKVWVRSVCGDNAFGAWIGPRTVTTTCAPVMTFSENFNASSSIPACFKRVGSGGNAYIQSSSLYLSSYEDGNAGNAMSYGLVSLPAVSNAVAGTHRLKFSLKSSGSVGGIVELGYMVNPENVASFTAVQAFTATSTTAQTIIYIPAAGAITAEVMAFRHTGNPSSAVLIDDIVWETAPACGDVTAIQVKDITNATAKVSWTGNTETNWEVAYGATTVTDPNTLTSIAVSDVTNTLLGSLEASTTYKVWVRSNCNELGFGAWIGPVQFATSCNPVASFSENFDGSNTIPSCWALVGGFMQSNSSPASAPNSVYMGSLNMLVTPPVSNASAGTHRLKFKARGTYGLGGVIQVGYMTGYNDAASFVALQSFTPTSTTVYDEFYVNLGTVPTTGYLALRHDGVSWQAVSIDDVVWEPLPSCEEVSELTNQFVSHDSATIAWTAASSTAWEIVYTDVSDNSTPSDLTPSLSDEQTFAISQFIPNTVYKVWVRSTCGNDEVSAWVGPLQFRTTCDPITDMAWMENFDGLEAPALPECWTKENGNWVLVDNSVPVFSPTVPTGPYSGNNYLRVYNGAVNNYMWTPGFELQANSSYDFSTFVQGDGYDGWSVEMVYNSQPKGEGAVVLGAAYEIPAGTVGEQPYEEMRRTFVPTISGTYFFAVRVNENSTGAPYYIAFDDFMVEDTDLSTPGFDTDAFKAYPNPVKDILNLTYTENISNVEVFNLIGQRVMTKTVNATASQLDMSDLASGSYLVKVTANNQVKTIKVIKQ